MTIRCPLYCLEDLFAVTAMPEASAGIAVKVVTYAVIVSVRIAAALYIALDSAALHALTAALRALHAALSLSLHISAEVIAYAIFVFIDIVGGRGICSLYSAADVTRAITIGVNETCLRDCHVGVGLVPAAAILSAKGGSRGRLSRLDFRYRGGRRVSGKSEYRQRDHQRHCEDHQILFHG